MLRTLQELTKDNVSYMHLAPAMSSLSMVDPEAASHPQGKDSPHPATHSNTQVDFQRKSQF